MTGYIVETYSTLKEASDAVALLSNSNEVHVTAYKDGLLAKFLVWYKPKYAYTPIVFTDDDGDNVTCTLVEEIGEVDVSGRGIYTVELAEAGDAEFYIDTDGSKSFYLVQFAVMTDCADTLKVQVEFKPLADWVSGGLAYSYATDERLDLDATMAAKWNPIAMMIPVTNTPTRVVLKLGAAGNAYIQGLQEA
jgi:hypothetical protein